ncbi:hypothetical protein DICPUDRAFT_85402 [Dictyostelium purpureum]|uniref:HIT-type domain-containing protein n=1 Tax=Dictyostelium purpureum TaxID=5786 RepID=F1A5M0_DICPU|nr:uncharacterized protein DICPUDRAFT_85402 [Dictyostelium purpureum]EGC28509.1 hypothetical protein DICPUDRAFT_85402 [Dictyostelium purpureum]|eukprot:XP_003294963.1 hypothetical protein DICPUDRAFT_85402 [Dictyostelium purpureum]
MAKKKTKFSDDETDDRSDGGGGDNQSEDDDELEDDFEDDEELLDEDDEELMDEDDEDEDIGSMGGEMEDDIGSESDATTTSRQRDIKRGSKLDISILTPSSGGKKKKELTEEMKQKKSELAIQRRNKKIEEDETMMRDVVNQLFYRKAATKESNIEEEKKPSRHDLYIKDNKGNTICYKDTPEEGKTISYPMGHPMIETIEKDINISKIQQQQPQKPIPIKCAVENCNRNKRYNCPKNNLPVCTMECYKKIMNQEKQ